MKAQTKSAYQTKKKATTRTRKRKKKWIEGLNKSERMKQNILEENPIVACSPLPMTTTKLNIFRIDQFPIERGKRSGLNFFFLFSSSFVLKWNIICVTVERWMRNALKFIFFFLLRFGMKCVLHLHQLLLLVAMIIRGGKKTWTRIPFDNILFLNLFVVHFMHSFLMPDIAKSFAENRISFPPKNLKISSAVYFCCNVAKRSPNRCIFSNVSAFQTKQTNMKT